MESELLLSSVPDDTSHDISLTKVYPSRWWILLSFSLMTLLQGSIWAMPGYISPTYESVYGIDDYDIQIFLGYGAFLWFVSCFPVMFHIDRFGPRVSFILSMGGILLSCILRCICDHMVPGSIYLLHISFILNALAGPVAMGACCRISEDWFPLSERVTATAIMVQSNNCSSLLMYLLVPLVNDESLGSLRKLNYVMVSLALIPTLMCIFYWPDRPPLPPSNSAGLRDIERSQITLKRVILDTKRALLSFEFVVYSAIYSLIGGLASTLGSLLTPILGTLGMGQSSAGWVGFGTTLFSILLSVLIARYVDFKSSYNGPPMKNSFSSSDELTENNENSDVSPLLIEGSAELTGISAPISLKPLMIMLMSSAMFYLLFGFILDGIIPLSDSNTDKSSTYLQLAFLIFVMVGSGSLFDAIIPLLYELAMEAAYPMTEGVALVQINCGMNFITAVTVIVPMDSAGVAWMPWVMAILNFLSGLSLVFLKNPTFNRIKMDRQ